jgi:hypothetical protein
VVLRKCTRSVIGESWVLNNIAPLQRVSLIPGCVIMEIALGLHSSPYLFLVYNYNPLTKVDAHFGCYQNPPYPLILSSRSCFPPGEGGKSRAGLMRRRGRLVAIVERGFDPRM